MKAASLGHQYLNFKSTKEKDNYHSRARSRASIVNQRRQLQSDENLQLTPASDPPSRRTTALDESSTPSVAVITRSFSDTDAPYAIYESEPTSKGKYRLFDQG